MDSHLPGFLCSWDAPGKDTGMGCHFLLQGIFPTQVSRIVGGFFAIWAIGEAQTSSGHLLSIITVDVFKDDLFLFIQTLWSKYYSFHLQNEEPEYQSYQETCSSSHWLNITLSSLRMCVLCNVRRVWICTFLPWWQKDEWYEFISFPVNRMAALPWWFP